MYLAWGQYYVPYTYSNPEGRKPLFNSACTPTTNDIERLLSDGAVFFYLRKFQLEVMVNLVYNLPDILIINRKCKYYLIF